MKTTKTITKNVFTACTKCAGSGKIAGMEHVANGICFKCGGSRGITTVVHTEVELTDNEIIQKLESIGITILNTEMNADADDVFAELEACGLRHADAMIGARLLLQGLAA